jgi:hypothetical protein
VIFRTVVGFRRMANLRVLNPLCGASAGNSRATMVRWLRKALRRSIMEQ